MAAGVAGPGRPGGRAGSAPQPVRSVATASPPRSVSGIASSGSPGERCRATARTRTRALSGQKRHSAADGPRRKPGPLRPATPAGILDEHGTRRQASPPVRTPPYGSARTVGHRRHRQVTDLLLQMRRRRHRGHGSAFPLVRGAPAPGACPAPARAPGTHPRHHRPGPRDLYAAGRPDPRRMARSGSFPPRRRLGDAAHPGGLRAPEPGGASRGRQCTIYAGRGCAGRRAWRDAARARRGAGPARRAGSAAQPGGGVPLLRRAHRARRRRMCWA